MRDPHFVNIKSHKKWNTSQIDAAGFSKRFDIDNPLYRDFSAAYSDYMEMTAAVINKGLEFYDHISYDVLDNEEVEANVHLHVGDVVDIKEEEEENSFAIIRAIVFHKANNVNMYIFLVIDWFQVISGKDKLLNCLYYMLQKPEEMHWRCVYPVTLVDHTLNTHFVHCCTMSCMGKHGENNRCYICNDFFYNTV